MPGNLLLDSGDVDGDGNTGELLPLDLAGGARVVDYPGVPGTSIDIGAFEASP